MNYVADHRHAPYGEVEVYNAAELGKCACGVDLVRYKAPEEAWSKFEEWQVTAIDDPCLSCGGFDTPSCCGVEE